MSEYFKRTINEGTVIRTHVLSTDNTIVITKLATRGKKVIDSIILSSVNNDQNKSTKTIKEKELEVRKELMDRLQSIRINGLPVLFEDLGDSFNDEEIMEVMTFINGGNMKPYITKDSKTEEILNNEDEELKND